MSDIERHGRDVDDAEREACAHQAGWSYDPPDNDDEFDPDHWNDHVNDQVDQCIRDGDFE